MTDLFKRLCGLIEIKTSLVIGRAAGQVQAGYTEDDAPDRCQTFIDRGGMFPHDLAQEQGKINLQDLARALSHFEAKADADALYAKIAGFKSLLVGANLPVINSGDEAWIVLSVDADIPPQFIGQDEKKRHLFSTNYAIHVSRV